MSPSWRSGVTRGSRLTVKGKIADSIPTRSNDRIVLIVMIRSGKQCTGLSSTILQVMSRKLSRKWGNGEF